MDRGMSSQLQLEFLNDLFSGYSNLGHIELRFLSGGPNGQKKSKGSKFFKDGPSVVNYLEDNDVRLKDSKTEVYFGVLPRVTPHVLSTMKKNVINAHVLWADIDLKCGRTINQVLNSLTYINNKVYPPSYIVHSGNGVHAYWLLEEPSKDMELLEDTVAGINKYLNGDPVHNRDRILRLPCTYNYKDMERPKNVRILRSPKHLYRIEDFSRFAALGKCRAKGSGPVLHTEDVNPTNIPWTLLPEFLLKYVHGGVDAAPVDRFVHKDGDNIGERNKSSFDFYVARQLLRYGFSKEEVAYVFLDEQYGIACLRKSNPSNYIRITIHKADNSNKRYQEDTNA